MPERTAPFPVTPELTAIAIAYRNPDVSLIADDVLPRVKAVGTRDFGYTVYDLSSFDRPNTYVGRKGRPNEVSMGSHELTAAIEATAWMTESRRTISTRRPAWAGISPASPWSTS